MRKRTPLADEDMLRLPDCISLTEKGSCTRLNISACIGEKCTFYCRDRENGEADRWRTRLKGLPEEQQLRISKKYYGGSMPWK